MKVDDELNWKRTSDGLELGIVSNWWVCRSNYSNCGWNCGDILV
jgi:hypothetical protein